MTSRFAPARPVALFLVLVVALATSGCNSFGPRAVRTSQTDYNRVLAESFTDQLLLNLVRLRYRDVPYFLDVQSLSAFYQVGGNLGAGASFGEGGDVSGSASAGVGFTERPTVFFAPLQGEAYVKQLLAAIPLDTVMLLPQNGWSIERVLRIAVQNLDVNKVRGAEVDLNRLPNAPSASGPTPDYAPHYRRFLDFTKSLRSLQREGLLTVLPCPVPRSLIEAGAEAEEEAELTCFRLEIETVTAQHEGAVTRILEHLELEPGDVGFEPGGTAVFTFASRKRGTETADLKLTTRSLMGILYFLSQGVEAPPAHEAEGLVTVTEYPTGERYDWHETVGELFTIHSSKERPAPGTAFAAVFYRDHWFYIEDSDLESKTTFGLLAQLVSLQSGDQRVTPILTLGGD